MRSITSISRIIIIGLLYICIPSTHGSTKCPPQESISRHVICYYEGRTSLNNLNLCNCTHIIFTDITRIAENYTLDVFEDARSDLSLIKETKNDLLNIFTLKTKPEQTSSILKSEDKRERLTKGIAGFLRDSGFDGVELNFDFSSQDGATKDSIVAFVKGLRNKLDSIPLQRVKRDGYEIFEKVNDDVTTASYTTQRAKSSKSSTTKKTRVKNSRPTREERKDVDFYDDDGSELAPVDEDFQEAPLRRVSRRRKELANSELEEENKTDEKSNNFLILVRLSIQPEIIGKKYDLKALSKYADLLMVPTHNIVDETERRVTYHPSRLMGLSDMLNTDSILDLLTGLGAPKSKLVITIPATVLKFQLAESSKNAPRSPTLDEPKLIDQSQLCSLISEGDWTVERDDDLTAPYAFSNKSWLAFEDKTSINIKGKYILLRELAGGAVYPIDADVGGDSCNNETGIIIPGSITSTLFNNFRSLERKPRALVLESLQNEIHDTSFTSVEAGLHLSEYRITRVVDHSGAVHVIRKNTKTEFECSRQGYFSHPLGCNKFYRCVKFNQYSDDFTVFEYDCPAGLAFDERWEVCVWPGSLPHGAPCTGSSEIAPVPRSHYQCPNHEGYYADPENCRWFFACLDHARDGISPLTAYEFRCPFGLVFDEGKLACDWPWLVGGCGNRGLAGVVITKTAGATTNIHSATFINGGNLAASYGQYGQDAYLTGFGASYENSIHEASGFGIKSGAAAGANYIASSYDDNQNKASFATVPEYEISGGRILNHGGVVLNQHLNLVGVSGVSGATGAAAVSGVSSVVGATGGAYNEINQYSNLESQRVQSGYAYEKPQVRLELPVQKSEILLQPQLVETIAEKAVLTKLEPTLYQYPLSTPRPFAVNLPSVQVNEEKASGYSSQTIISSTPETYVSSTPQTFVSSTPQTYVSSTPQTYVSSTPQTYVSSTPQTIVSVTPQTVVTAAKSVSEGYVYEKPAVQLQLPAVTPKPDVYVDVKQTSFEGYSYEKPKVAFELPQNEVHTVTVQQPTVRLPTPRPFAVQQPVIQYQPIAIKSRPIVSSTPAPVFYKQAVSVTPIIQEQKYVTPIQVSSPRPFSIQQEIVQPVSISTPRPIVYEQRQEIIQPVVSTPRPFSIQQEVVQPVQKVVQPVVQQQYVQQEIVQPVQPVVQQQYVQVSTPRPVVYEQRQKIVQPVAISTPRPVVYEQREYLPPVQVSTPKIIYESPKVAISTARPFVFEQRQQYVTPRPVVYEQKQYVTPVAPVQPVVYEQRQQYVTPKPVVYEQQVQISTPKPIVVQQVQVSTPRPVVYEQREYLPPVQVSTPRPVVYKQQVQQVVQPVVQQQYVQQEIVQPVQPVVQQQYVQVSTPKPVVYSQSVKLETPKPVVYQQVQPIQISTPRTLVYSQQKIRPIQPVVQQEFVQVSTPKPVVYQQPIQISTPRPVVYTQQKVVQPVVQQEYVQVSTPKQIVQPVVQQEYVQVSTPKQVVQPVVQQEYVQVSTPKPVVYTQSVQLKTPQPVVYQQPIQISTPKPVQPVQIQQEYIQYKQQPIVRPTLEYLPPETPKAVLFGLRQRPIRPVPIQVSTPRPVVYEQKQYVQVTTPQPVVTAQYLPPKQVTVKEYLPPVQVSTPKQVVYEQKQVIQPVQISTPQPIVTQREYLPPVTVSTAKPVIYEQQQYVQTERPVVYQEEYVSPKVQVSTVRPIYRQQYVQPVSRPQEIFYKQPQQTLIVQQPIEVSTSKTIYEEHQTITEKPIVVQESPAPIVVEQRFKQRQRPVVYQEEYVQQVSTEREYLPPAPSTTETVLVEEPVVYTQKTKFRSRYRNEEFAKKTKESTAYFVESYEKTNPAVSVLQQEIIQTEAPLVETREYLPPISESAAIAEGAFEFQKLNTVEKVKPAVVEYQSTEKTTAGYDYSSPATVKYQFNSKIEIAPPPEEYLLDVTSTTKLPETSSRYSARTRTRVRTRPTTSTEAAIEAYSAPEYLPPSSENYPENYVPPRSNRRRPSGRKSKTTVVTIGQVDKQEVDDENVEVLLDKYSGKFGDLLDEDKEKFVTKVIQGDGKGKIKVGKEPEVSTVGYEVTSSRSRSRGRGRKFKSSTSTTTTEAYELEEEEEETSTIDNEDTADLSLTSLDLKNLKLKKDKKTVIVVSQVSDANPLLIGKLASQCSCQSNNVELKKGRKDDSPDGYDEYSTTEGRKRGRGRTRKPASDNEAVDAVSPNVDYRSGIDDTSDATVLIGGPRTRRPGSRYRGGNESPSTRYEDGNSSPGYDTGDNIDSSSALPSFEIARKVPSTTEALFLPEKPNGRRIPSRSRSRNENYDSSPNDVASIPLFSPVPADEIASTVDYASVKGRRPENSVDDGLSRKSVGSAGEKSKVAAGAAFDRYGPGGWRGADETLQGSVDCKRPGLFRHPKYCNKFYSCNYDPWKKRYTLSVFNCPIHLAYDSNIGACNWPSKGPACQDDNLLV